MKIFLIRHAEAEGDPFVCPERPVKGCLSQKGILQAKKLAKSVKDFHFDVAFSSPYGRALQTAEIALKSQNIPIRILSFLHEWLPGKTYEKMPRAEFELLQKQTSRMFAEETWKTDLGEGCYDMFARICPPFLKELDNLGIHCRMGGFVIDKKSRHLSIAIFAHAGSLATLLSFLLEMRPFPVSRIAFEQTGVAILKFSECKGISYPKLIIPS